MDNASSKDYSSLDGVPRARHGFGAIEPRRQVIRQLRSSRVARLFDSFPTCPSDLLDRRNLFAARLPRPLFTNLTNEQLTWLAKEPNTIFVFLFQNQRRASFEMRNPVFHDNEGHRRSLRCSGDDTVGLRRVPACQTNRGHGHDNKQNPKREFWTNFFQCFEQY